jgi:uncharacterized protein YcbK (DUF882 family)
MRLDRSVMINRRHMLGLATAAACCAPCMALAQAGAGADPIGQLLARSADTREVRRLNLFNLHTQERADAVYWEKGEYVASALEAINLTLRDFRSGHVWPMDVRLLDAVSAVAAAVGDDRPLQIVSGYRSPSTNAMLAARSNEVSDSSVHMEGLAMDFYLDNTPLDRLHAAAISQYAGGVGIYPVTGFIHMDVARVRYWQGT